MADTPQAASSGASTPSNAENQARIRKERREAKIRAGGSARLNKITGLGGGVQRDAPIQSTHGDPDEVDISTSEHFYEPKQTPRPRPNAQQSPSDDQLRQMMLGFDPASAPPPGANPFAGFPGMGAMGGMNMPGMEGMPDSEDPMMKMLQQMMGSMGEGPGGMPTFPGMPPQPGQVAPASPSTYLWRIVHAIFAIGLGLYIAFTTTFTGTKIERERSAIGLMGEEDGVSAASVRFFWIFATVELVLQSSRFMMEKGKVQQGGIMGMAMGFLPEPYKGYLALATRYARIWTTVSADAMACLFVLGVCVWLRGN